jgi:hypothetical protein
MHAQGALVCFYPQGSAICTQAHCPRAGLGWAAQELGSSIPITSTIPYHTIPYGTAPYPPTNQARPRPDQQPALCARCAFFMSAPPSGTQTASQPMHNVRPMIGRQPSSVPPHETCQLAQAQPLGGALAQLRTAIRLRRSSYHTQGTRTDRAQRANARHGQPKHMSLLLTRRLCSAAHWPARRRLWPALACSALCSPTTGRESEMGWPSAGRSIVRFAPCAAADGDQQTETQRKLPIHQSHKFPASHIRGMLRLHE